MDNQRLFEAACTGNIEVLFKSLQDNPLVLTDLALSDSKETLLHVATKAGQLSFVREILKHKPELATELSNDGFRPLDIAAAIGNIEIVRELLKSDHYIYRLQGKDKRTALHYAAMNGRVAVIDELLSKCSESIEDITIYRETALHLAVKNHQIEAFSALVKWLERLNMQPVINWADCDGNSVLHLATSRKQFESVELLLGAYNGILVLNATNSKGLTAMDVLDIVIENPNDFQLRKILQRARAVGAQDANAISPASSLMGVTENNIRHDLPSEPLRDWFRYFKFHVQRDSPSDTRNALLVVAALIASVTFQAGLNPPTRLKNDNSPSNQSNSGYTSMAGSPPAAAAPALTSGLAAFFGLLGTQATGYLFTFGNTLGLTASLSIIIYLTGGFPFQRELHISIYSMMFTYGISIDGITPRNGLTYALLAISFALPFMFRWLPRWGKKASKWWRGPPSQTLPAI